jgi:hypothetical protein
VNKSWYQINGGRGNAFGRYLLEQDRYHLARFVAVWKGYGCDGRIGIRGAAIVEPDDGNILRDAFSNLPESPQRADCIVIRRAYNGGEFLPLGDQLVGGVRPISIEMADLEMMMPLSMMPACRQAR